MDEIQEIIEAALDAEAKGLPSKSFAQLLAEGVKHNGGLVWLAAAERSGTLFGGPPRRPTLRLVK